MFTLESIQSQAILILKHANAINGRCIDAIDVYTELASRGFPYKPARLALATLLADGSIRVVKLGMSDSDFCEALTLIL